MKGRVNNMDENEFRLWTDSVWWFFELEDTTLCLFIPASVDEDTVRGLVLELLVCGAINYTATEIVDDDDYDEDDLAPCLN